MLINEMDDSSKKYYEPKPEGEKRFWKTHIINKHKMPYGDKIPSTVVDKDNTRIADRSFEGDVKAYGEEIALNAAKRIVESKKKVSALAEDPQAATSDNPSPGATPPSGVDGKIDNLDKDNDNPNNSVRDCLEGIALQAAEMFDLINRETQIASWAQDKLDIAKLNLDELHKFISAGTKTEGTTPRNIIGYHVIHNKTGQVLKKYGPTGGNAASRYVDKKDNEYGGYAHSRKAIWSEETDLEEKNYSDAHKITKFQKDTKDKVREKRQNIMKYDKGSYNEENEKSPIKRSINDHRAAKGLPPLIKLGRKCKKKKETNEEIQIDEIVKTDRSKDYTLDSLAKKGKGFSIRQSVIKGQKLSGVNPSLRKVQEEDELDELSKDKIHDYIQHSTADASDRLAKLDRMSGEEDKKISHRYRGFKIALKKFNEETALDELSNQTLVGFIKKAREKPNKQKAVSSAYKRLGVEETELESSEELDELSQATLKRYKKTISDNMRNQRPISDSRPTPLSFDRNRKKANRAAGWKLATRKQVREETEQLDEIPGAFTGDVTSTGDVNNSGADLQLKPNTTGTSVNLTRVKSPKKGKAKVKATQPTDNFEEYSGGVLPAVGGDKKPDPVKSSKKVQKITVENEETDLEEYFISHIKKIAQTNADHVKFDDGNSRIVSVPQARRVMKQYESQDRGGKDHISRHISKDYDSLVKFTRGEVTEELGPAARRKIVKKAHKGEDIGKKGKNFKKIEDKAAKEYGSKKAGERVAGAILFHKK